MPERQGFAGNGVAYGIKLWDNSTDHHVWGQVGFIIKLPSDKFLPEFCRRRPGISGIPLDRNRGERDSSEGRNWSHHGDRSVTDLEILYTAFKPYLQLKCWGTVGEVEDLFLIHNRSLCLKYAIGGLKRGSCSLKGDYYS